MNIAIDSPMIPGTILKRKDMGNVTGLQFLNKIFYISDGIMLTQIRDVSGIDGTTLQNWTKRGWVENAKLKRYNKDQLAHILIINMLRSCMQLDRIAFVIRYINGSLSDRSDDIIGDAELYDYICLILDELMKGEACTPEGVKACVAKVTAQYEERITGARKRLEKALEIIVFAYYASLLKQYSDQMTEKLMKG